MNLGPCQWAGLFGKSEGQEDWRKAGQVGSGLPNDIPLLRPGSPPKGLHLCLSSLVPSVSSLLSTVDSCSEPLTCAFLVVEAEKERVSVFLKAHQSMGGALQQDQH